MIEKIIISTLIEAGLEASKLVMPSINKEHFAGRERELIELIDSKVKANQTFDAKILAEEMKGEDSEGYLNNLKTKVGKKSLLESYIRKLADRRAKERIARLCVSQDTDAFTSISQISEQRILAQVEKTSFIELKYAAVNVCEAAENNKGVDFAFSFAPLKVLAAGINRGEVMLIAGYTSQGKTALALKLADSFACNKHKVLYCSSEMPIKDIVIRLFCRRCRINSEKFRTGKLNENDIEAIANESMDMQIPLYLASVSTANEVRVMTERVKPDIVFVDHLHQLTGQGKRFDVVSAAILSLKNLAIEKNVAMIVGAQLHRSEFYDKKGLPPKPRKSDLRASGEIEENSQIISFLYWPYGFTLDSEKYDKNKSQLIVAKNTSGPLGYSKVFFRPENYEFLRWEK